MNNENFLEKLAAQFGQNASVKNVFGEPIITDNKTIIPVAQIAYGLGGGHGHGKNKIKASTTGDDNIVGEGAGGGGGMFAKPKGVYEITPDCTRFIPASSSRILVTGLVMGFLIRRLFFSGRRKK